jgi:multidrug resistance efflux pump
LLELDLAEAQLALDRAEKESARIEQLRATNAISQEQVDQKRFELAQAKILVQRATAKLQAGSPAVESRATAEPVGPSQRTEIRLLELDLADAKLAVEEAESELARMQQIQKQSPAALSEQEIRKYQFQADRAKIQVQRIMIKLEGAKAEPQPARR